MRIDPFCSDLMFEVAGTCNFWLGNYEKALNFYKKLKIDTRDSLFYSAAAYSELGDRKKASEALKQAKNTLKMSLEKFLGSQPFKSDDTRKQLESSLNALETV